MFTPALVTLLLLQVLIVQGVLSPGNDPVQGTASFAVIYEHENNGTPDNSVTVELERPDGSSNRQAVISYTINYRIAPIVPGAGVTNEVSFNVATTTGVELVSESAPITGTSATSDVFAGVVQGEQVAPLGSDIVISVTTDTNSNVGDDEGSFSGFITYTVAIVEGSTYNLDITATIVSQSGVFLR